MKKNDLIIILLCVTASIISGLAFLQEYSRTHTKLNENPIGTIVFKKKTAQRKLADRIAWDMLKQKSEIYNADTIRTTKASEAIITFIDDTAQHITMNENTIIQIFYSDKEGAKIDLSGGNLDVNAGGTGIAITSGSSEIIVTGRANLDKKDEWLSFSVTEGAAVFDGERIEAGKMVILDGHGERVEIPSIMVTSLNASARILSASEGATPVNFEWNAFNFNSDTFVIVETAYDPLFSRIIQAVEVTSGNTASIPMNIGGYFWRAYPASLNSREPANPMYPQGTLEIIPASRTALTAPENKAEITADFNLGILLSWTAIQGASSYLLEISANADMSSPAVARHIEGTRVSQTGLDTGVWYWRVTPVPPGWITGALPSSEIRSFNLEGYLPQVQEVAEEKLPFFRRIFKFASAKANEGVGNIISKTLEIAVDNFGPEINTAIQNQIAAEITDGSVKFNSIETIKGGGLKAEFAINTNIITMNEIRRYARKTNEELLAEFGITANQIPSELLPILSTMRKPLVLDFKNDKGSPILSREITVEEIMKVLGSN